MIEVNVAEHLLSIVGTLVVIFGSILGLIVRAVTLSNKVAELEKDLEAHKIEAKKETLRLESRFDNLQVSVTQILQGVGRLEGIMEHITHIDRRK